MNPKSRNSRREMSKALSRVANASVSETLEEQKSIPINNLYRIGVTGAPGAGKSTLISHLASKRVQRDRKIGVIAIDPTSPVSKGSLLGDRIRMETVSDNPNIFIQHRGHSTYLAFGGNMVELIDELLGRKTGCANGMGGSASIQSKENNIFGHDGLMGSQVPIAVGHCFITKEPTIVFCGDSAGEEDYVFSAIGWAATKNLPILFVIEDNNLSILTEKKVRRNWELDEVAKGFGVKSFNISDDPIDIKKSVENFFEYPILLNINTVRKFWHAGAGIDNEDVFDRYLFEMESLGNSALKIHDQSKKQISGLWEKQLEKQ